MAEKKHIDRMKRTKASGYMSKFKASYQEKLNHVRDLSMVHNPQVHKQQAKGIYYLRFPTCLGQNVHSQQISPSKP